MKTPFLFDLLLVAVFATAAVVFLVLHFITAPYGRHGRKGWGPSMSARWGWVIMESPAVLVMAACFLISERKTDLMAVVFIGLWQMHYMQRTFVYPMLMPAGARKIPLMVMGFAILFNVINGYLNGAYLFLIGPVYSSQWLTDPRFIAGTVIFLSGFLINLHSDSLLRRLARNRAGAGYQIPSGGLFNFVSSANYFGEVIEWSGWALLTWSLPGLAFALFTAANLAPRARAHHRWYQETFPDYPRKRKALIPFLY